MPDCQSTLDLVEGYSLYSALDLKAEFENVVLDPAMTRFHGLVTQDGLYILEKMTFGFNTAPAHFQAIMMTVMDAEPNRPTNSTYINDITLVANNVSTCWWDTLKPSDICWTLGSQ